MRISDFYVYTGAHSASDSTHSAYHLMKQLFDISKYLLEMKVDPEDCGHGNMLIADDGTLKLFDFGNYQLPEKFSAYSFAKNMSIAAVQFASFLTRSPSLNPDASLALYQPLVVNSHYDCAKAPGLNDRKSVHISNIDRLAIVQPRELSRGQNGDFQLEAGIKLFAGDILRFGTHDLQKVCTTPADAEKYLDQFFLPLLQKLHRLQ